MQLLFHVSFLSRTLSKWLCANCQAVRHMCPDIFITFSTVFLFAMVKFAFHKLYSRIPNIVHRLCQNENEWQLGLRPEKKSHLKWYYKRKTKNLCTNDGELVLAMAHHIWWISTFGPFIEITVYKIFANIRPLNHGFFF